MASELGFYHRERGYWQAIGEPGAAIRATYLDGTIEVPLRPGEHFAWDGVAWVHRPPAPLTSEGVRARAPSLTARQLRLGLVQAGVSLSDITKSIAEMPGGAERDITQIEWEYATTFKRTHPLIATIGAAVGLTDDQIDELWQAAVNL